MYNGTEGQCVTCGTQVTADELGTLVDQTGGDVCTERDDAGPHLLAAARDDTGHALGCSRDHPDHTECPVVLRGCPGPGEQESTDGRAGGQPQPCQGRREEAAGAGIPARA